MRRLLLIVLFAVYFEATSGQRRAGDIEVGELPNIQHDIGGTLYVRDAKTLVIENFSYDGLGPVTFLYSFRPGQQRSHGGGTIIPLSPPEGNDEGAFVFRRRYRGDKTLVIKLPEGMDACDIGLLTMWCRPFRVFFTEIKLNNSKLFEDSGLGEGCVLKGRGVTTPMVETTATEAPTTTESPTTTTEAPRVGVEVGPFPEDTLHDISGVLHVLDSKTLFIEDFTYDGIAPGAFVYYYSPGQIPDRNGGGFFIPVPGGTDRGGFVNGRGYRSEDLILKLPEGVDACDIGTLTIWCEPFGIFFAVLEIPVDEVFVPDAEECTLRDGVGTLLPFMCPNGQFASSAADCEFDNCMSLDNQLQLSWTVRDTQREIDFRLCGCESADTSLNQYMGFGLSGADSFTLMFGADATIAWVDDTTGPHAEDYFLGGYFQCRGGQGVCPDSIHSSGSCTNDILAVTGSNQGGQQCVIYTKSYSTNDSTCDKPIDPSNMNQYIVWGVGGLGETAFQHFIRATSTTPPIHFGRTPENQCTAPVQCVQCVDTFQPAVIEALEDSTFTVKIGPSGADRGYEAIAGQVGWGIALYVNDTLIPELIVQRGSTYTFIIEAGDDSEDPANYHPVYITDDIHGSRVFKTPEDMQTEQVYAGFDGLEPTAAGRLCSCIERDAAVEVRETCGTRQEYEAALECSCREGEPAVLTWTPDQATPDVVYYQCAIHLNLGWRIRVQDAPDPCATFDCPSHAVCRVFEPTGEPYCDPSCDIDNGGCAEDEICQLLATPCAAPPPPRPCPLVVVCEVPDPCLGSPCDPNAVCTRDSTLNSDFTCTCTPPFQGDGVTCEIPDPCELNPCDPNAVCTRDSTLNSEFTCSCNAPFEGDGVTCEILDPCLASPCDPNAVCTRDSTLNSDFTCACNAPFEGDGVTCEFIDPCLSSPCDPNAGCTRTSNLDFTCACFAPFEGDGFNCSFSDPCKSGPCGPYAECTLNSTQTLGFTCACIPPFEGDGLNCTFPEVDPCDGFECPPATVCRVFTIPFEDKFPQLPEAYCEPSCEVDNGGCTEDEICTLMNPPECPTDVPCPVFVECTPKVTIEPAQIEGTVGEEVTITCIVGPVEPRATQLLTEDRQLLQVNSIDIQSDRVVFTYGPLSQEDDGREVFCSFGPFQASATISVLNPCDGFECPSHAVCKVFTSPNPDLSTPPQAFCDPSCELDNGGCEEDEICTLIPPVCPPDLPCPFFVQCSPRNPCEDFECPSHATCESSENFLGILVAYCVPSCELDNGGCGEDEVCTLVPRGPLECLQDAPCPPAVTCSPRDPCATFDCPSHAECLVFEPTGEPFCDPSCDIDNGGCAEDEICQLLATPCAAPPPPRPCPLVVVCEVPDPCLGSPCDPNAVCTRDSTLNSDFTCTCTPPFQGDGVTCEFIDPCLSSPCDPNAGCTRTTPCDGFECPSHAVCKVFTSPNPDLSTPPQAFCDPSCDLNNGGCEEDEICNLIPPVCPPDLPCPFFVQCSPRNPCEDFECPSHATCESSENFLGILEAYCVPSCELDNGGCGEDEVCTLVPRGPLECLQDAPCPPAVTCILRDPCATVRCRNGYSCKVYPPTGEAFCEPSCDLNNGGCSPGTHCILRDDSECTAGGPCPPLRSCCPHPRCDMDFCSARRTRRALCTNPYSSCGTEECPVTFCHTCYFSQAERALPGNCADSCPDYSTSNRCSRRWATCIRRAHPVAYGKPAWPRPSERIEADFFCYSPPQCAQN